MEPTQPRGDAGGRVLVIEDDRVLRQAVVSAVESAGYEVTAVGDGLSGTEELRTQHYDVVLLDLGLPFVDGWRILSTLEGRRIPSVVVISARGEESDKVRALDMGADDYLAKPFGADELVARVRAVLRRARPPGEAPRVVHRGEVAIDLGQRTVFRGGHEVRLTATEYLLLAELARHAGEVLDHRTLLKRVWGPAYGSEMSYLRAFIHRLRAKLEADPAHPELVITVGRQGYRLGPAAPSEAEAPLPGR
jgi:two-component system KDP operon response regulator KdpE